MATLWNHSSDKDAVQAVLLSPEVAARLKNEGKTLYDGLQATDAKHGTS